MTYSKEEINKLAQLVSFTDDPDLHQALAEQDKQLATEVTRFHVEVVILKCILEYSKELGRNASYLELRDYMKEKVFKGDADNISLEQKMDEFLPILTKKKLITKKMSITKLGKTMVAAKEIAFQNNKNNDIIH